MKMNISRDNIVASRPEAKLCLNLSLQIGKDIASSMQSCGISSIRLSRQDTIAGSSLVYKESSLFDNVPTEIAIWSEPIIEAFSKLMSAVGITEINLTEEGNDIDALRLQWDRLVEDDTQLSSIASERTNQPRRQNSTNTNNSVSQPNRDSTGEIIL